MTQSELKEKIEKLDKAIKSPTTPASFLPSLKSKKEGFESELKNLSKPEAPKAAAPKPAAPKPVAEKPAAPKPAASKPAAEKPAASKSAKSITMTAAEKCRELLNQDKARKKSEEKRVTTRKKQGKPAKLRPSEVVNKTAKAVQSKVVTMDMSKAETNKLSTGFVMAIRNALNGIKDNAQKHRFIQSIITDLNNIDRKFKKTAEYGGYMADGGETEVEQEQMVTRGFYEDEPYEYASGGVNNTKKWRAVFITMQGRKGIKEITLGRMSEKQDVQNALKRMPDMNIREVISIEELKEDGGYMARGGVASKFEVGDKVMVDDSGYVKSFHGVDLSKPATITSKNKVKFGGKTYFTYNIETADGRKPYNTAVESKLMPVGMANGGMMAHGGESDYKITVGTPLTPYNMDGAMAVNIEHPEWGVFNVFSTETVDYAINKKIGYISLYDKDLKNWKRINYADGGMMAKGGIYSSDDTWVVTFQNQDTGEFEEVTVRANNKSNAIATAEDESGLSNNYKYYSVKKSMAHGGKTQGYDDREDERLAMKYGRMGSKDLDSTHARRDDARFEERMDDGGMMAKGGELDAQLSNIKGNILGTMSFDLKINGMRKPQDFIVYPVSSNESGKYITIQSDTRIGKINLMDGKGMMSQSHSNGAYFYHLSMDKKTPFVLSESDLKELNSKILGSRGKEVGKSVIISDNSNAGIMARGGRPLSAINRDRAYESQDELWEQNYKRQTRPKHPKYSK